MKQSSNIIAIIDVITNMYKSPKYSENAIGTKLQYEHQFMNEFCLAHIVYNAVKIMNF